MFFLSVIALIFQAVLLLFFLFFAFYNYRYQIASLFPPKFKKTAGSFTAKVAIIIVCRNEKAVICDTIQACERLTYANKTIIIGDDSNDTETMKLLRPIAHKYGCNRLNHNVAFGFDEAYESERFVLFHREKNNGFKAGNIKRIEGYLKAKGFEYLYILDADWHPEPTAIEQCLEVIEAEPAIAYVQTCRNSYYGKWEHFRRCLGMMEESCYYVDLVGRQVLGEMILFTGCCALFRRSHLEAVGGFMPGHLTEDIDLSNRCYLAGYKGVYLNHVKNTGEVPPNYKAYRRQQDRWTRGSARVLRDYFFTLMRSDKLSLRTKLSLIRQNAYFTVSIGTVLSIVIALSVFLCEFWATHVMLEPWLFIGITDWVSIVLPFAYLIFFSSILYLVILICKKREWRSLLYIPLVWWLNLSIIHTYFIANIKGFQSSDNTWFLTPKTNRIRQKVHLQSAWGIRAVNLLSLVLITVMYGSLLRKEGVIVALVLPYAISWIPAFMIGSLKS